MKLKYTEEQVKIAVSQSKCYADVFRNLGIKINGGSYSWLKRMIKRFNLDITHFIDPKTLFALNKGNHFSKIRASPKFEIIRTQRVRAEILRNLLQRNKIIMQCSICLLTEWMGYKLTLDIDHKDGDCLNNHISNLQFICPNCHRQKTQNGRRPTNRTSNSSL